MVRVCQFETQIVKAVAKKIMFDQVRKTVAKGKYGWF